MQSSGLVGFDAVPVVPGRKAVPGYQCCLDPETRSACILGVEVPRGTPPWSRPDRRPHPVARRSPSHSSPRCRFHVERRHGRGDAHSRRAEFGEVAPVRWSSVTSSEVPRGTFGQPRRVSTASREPRPGYLPPECALKPPGAAFKQTGELPGTASRICRPAAPSRQIASDSCLDGGTKRATDRTTALTRFPGLAGRRVCSLKYFAGLFRARRAGCCCPATGITTGRTP